MSVPFLPCWTSARAVLPVVVALTAAAPAAAAVITSRDMARGFSATAAQCAALANAVWVNVGRYRFCIRYYLSAAGGVGEWPAVFLQGDRHSGRFDGQTGRYVPDPAARDVDTTSLGKFADLLSRSTRTTAIYLARIGVDGSSGHQDLRRTVLEGQVLDRALEAIKSRHKFSGFHLAGQSGGAANIGALLALRSDIGCAVPGSGPLAFQRPQAPAPLDPLLSRYNGLHGIAAIVRNRPHRVLIVTDPRDRTVAAASQTMFARELAKAGGPVEQYFVEATDDKHHGVTTYATYALASCMDGMSRQDITRGLADLVARRLAAGAAESLRGPALQRLTPGPAAPAANGITFGTGAPR
jgi:hypothetical protein